MNDLFTVDNTDGNQALTYPIGLITADELMLSGYADGYLNRTAYTYSSSTYWTMSPSYFSTPEVVSREFALNSDGYIASTNLLTTYGVRGVINLRGNVEIESGIGTANDPYIVKVA